MFRSLFRRRGDPRPQALYQSIVEQARQPDFYRVLGVADTLDGRFDMLLLHLSATIDRFRNPDRSVSETGQALFDLFVTDMDHNLRQMGIGDLSVPKKMKKIGQSFYGRFGAYTRAEDRHALAAAIGRNVFPDDFGSVRPAALALATYYMGLADALARQDEAALTAGRVDWPPVPGLDEAASRGARGEDEDGADDAVPDQAAEAGR